MVKITAYGDVKDGKLIFANKKRFINELATFKNCAVDITIKKRNTRSTQQNRFYWGVVIAEINYRLIELGNDFEPETVHEFLKDKFNKVNMVGEGGELIDQLGGSTTEMNKEEFMVYVDKIIEWAASFLSITIPLPNSDLQFQF